MPFDVLLIREGTKLAAADPISFELLQAIPLRQTLTASIRRPRNPRHHAKLWTLISAVLEHQHSFPTKEDLLNAIKLATGSFDTGKTVDGVPYVMPQSISFASMDQARFEQWYERAVEVILTKIVPSINRTELEARIYDVLDGRSA